MLVDGSGSMVTENLWEPLKEAMSEVVASLPDHALLEIAIFDARKSGGWGSSREPFYGDGDGGPPLAFDLSTPADRDRAIRSIELFATPDTSNRTPLYWALDRCLQEQEAWLDGDPSKQFHIYLYSDGEDQFKGGTVTEADLGRRIRALDESIKLINGLSDWYQIVIGDKYDGLAMDGLPVIKSEGAIKLPLPPPSADLVAPNLPAASGGVTTAELRVNVPCPAYMPGDIDLTVTGTQPGVTISVSPSSIPTGGGLQDVPLLKFHVTGAEGQVRMAQQAELVVHFPDTNCDRRFLPQGSREARLNFSIAKDDSFSFDSSAVRVRPRVAMVDRDVAIQYLQPIAGVTPAWSRSDGGLIDANVDDPWSALTSFTKPGHYEIVLSGERDGSDATASTTMTVEVLDFELSLQSQPIDALEGKPIQITATFSGSAQVIEFQWRMNGVPLAEVTTAPTTTVTPNRDGRTEVAVRARILVGDQEELTGWVTVIFEVRESPRIRVQSRHAADWCVPLPVQAVTHGGVGRVTFSLLDAEGVTVSTAKAGVLTKERDDGRTVQLAEAQLEVPAKAGLYTVHAVADEHAGVADQVTVEVTPPKVTLRPLGDVSRKLQLDETDHLIVEISSDTPGAVETVTWHVDSDSGVVLEQVSPSSGHTTTVVAPDGSTQASIDLRFRSESNVPLDQPIRIIATPHICGQEGPSESHAVAFERTPVFEMPEWKVAVSGTRTDVPWLARESFHIEPQSHIADDGAAIDWVVRAKPGHMLVEGKGLSVFEHEFDHQAGEYTVSAQVTPALGGVAKQAVPITIMVRHDPPVVSADLPDGSVMRGGQSLPVSVTISGAVERAEWVATDESDQVIDRGDIAGVARGSSQRHAEFHVPAHPDGVGKVQVSVVLHKPSGQASTQSVASLQTMPPQKFWQFVVLSLACLIVFVFICIRFHGNGPRKWKLGVSIDRGIIDGARPGIMVGLDGRPSSVDRGWWDVYRKRASVPLRVIAGGRWPKSMPNHRPGDWLKMQPGAKFGFGAGGEVGLEGNPKHYQFSHSPENPFTKPEEDWVWRLGALQYEGDGANEIFVKVIRPKKTAQFTVDLLVICVALLITVGVVAISWQAWMQ